MLYQTNYAARRFEHAHQHGQPGERIEPAYIRMACGDRGGIAKQRDCWTEPERDHMRLIRTISCTILRGCNCARN
jgi:hypothetical protein